MIVEGGWHWMAKTTGGVLNHVPIHHFPKILNHIHFPKNLWGNDELKVGEKESFISNEILKYIAF